MAKKGYVMSFADCYGHVKDFIGLKDDGDSTTVVIWAEPKPRASEYQGKRRVRFLIPVVQDGVLKWFEMSARAMKDLHKVWKDVIRKRCTLTRVGLANDQKTTYTWVSDPDQSNVVAEIDGIDHNALNSGYAEADRSMGVPVQELDPDMSEDA